MKNSIATTVANLTGHLNAENEKYVKSLVYKYIDNHDTGKMVKSYERENIIQSAWDHVCDKRAKFNAAKGVKFTTWAAKVAINFAKDELAALSHDPLHGACSIETGLRKLGEGEDAEVQVCYLPIQSKDDVERELYIRETLEALKRIVSTYSGRERKVANMLLEEHTRDEIMDATQMSRTAADTFIFRLRRKMLSDLHRAGYDLEF